MILDYSKVEYAEFDLSTRCNAKCPLCYRNYKAFKEHYPNNIERDLSELKAQIAEFPNLKWIYLVGSISEPTMYSHFLELVQHIKTRGILIELCTNGSTRNPKFWKDLGRLLTTEDKVYFTICGSTQELHETYRRGTNLAKILENARALRSVTACDYAQCIRFSYNNADFESAAFKELIGEFTHIYMTETFIQQPREMYRNDFDWDTFKPAHSKFDDIQKLANSLKVGSFKCDCESIEYKKIQVDVYGNVYPCYLFLEASHGELWNGNYSNILNGKYECCRFCARAIKRYLIKHDLVNIV